MPPKKKQQQPAAASSSENTDDNVPGITRLPTAEPGAALIRGHSFAQAIKDDRKQRQEKEHHSGGKKKSTSPRRSSHGGGKSSARSSSSNNNNAKSATEASDRLSSVIARGFTTSELPPIEREPTMLHNKGGNLVPSISPVRTDLNGLEFPGQAIHGVAAAAAAAPLTASSSSSTGSNADVRFSAASHKGSKNSNVKEDDADGTTADEKNDDDDGDADSAEKQQMPASPQLLASGHTRYSIILDLDETVVYGREGELVARAHLKQFMRSLDSARTEVIVWTAAERSYAKQVVKEINENNVIRHCIYRDPNWFDAKDYTKDLTKLGRDMDYVLIIENTPDCVRENPQNGIIVSDFEGDLKHRDSTLLKLSMVIDKLVESTLPVPKFLASCSMLRRQKVDVGDDRQIPIFFLSARALRTPKKDAAVGSAFASKQPTTVAGSAASNNSNLLGTVGTDDSEDTQAGGGGVSSSGQETTNDDDDDDDQPLEESKVVKVNRDKQPPTTTATTDTTSGKSPLPPPATPPASKPASSSSSSQQQQQPSTPQQQRAAANGPKTPAGGRSNPTKLLTPRNRPILKTPRAGGGASSSKDGFDAPTGLPPPAHTAPTASSRSKTAIVGGAGANSPRSGGTTRTNHGGGATSAASPRGGAVRRQREENQQQSET